MTTVTFGARTHTGNVRDHNEDSYTADADLGLWLVADGMGGHDCGEVASEIVVNTVSEQVKNGASLKQAIQLSHEAIISSAKKGIGKSGMGSTIVAMQLNELEYSIAWVGDSRAYLWDGKLRQISKDHSLVQMLVDAGVISMKQALTHPQKHIVYQNLGAADCETVNTASLAGKFYKDEKILLCSDGLNDEIDHEDIENIIANNDDDQKIVDGLIDKVLSAEANDNITIIVISAPENAPEGSSREEDEPIKKDTLVNEETPP